MFGSRQATYCPTNTRHFSWDGDWYKFDSKAAHEAAKKERDDHAKELKASGRSVKKFTLGKQFRTKGGIGSGHPQIDIVVTVYGLNILD